MRSELVRRYGPWIGILVFAVAYYPRFIKDPNGMIGYPHAAECLLNNLALPQCDKLFTYPPAFASAMIPFVPLPLWGRNLLWYAITLGATAIVCHCSERLAMRRYPEPWPERDVALFRGITVLLSLKFILAVLENQAYDLLSLVFIMTGLWAIAYGRANAGAASIAIAAAIKATPLVFLPWLVIKRRYAAAVVFVVVFVVASALPDVFFTPKDAAHGYWMTWLDGTAFAAFKNDISGQAFAFWSGNGLFNQSLHGALARLIDEYANPSLFKAVYYTAWLACAALVGLLLLRSPRNEASVGTDGAILVISMLALSPMSSRSHFVVLLLPYAMLAAACVRDASMRAFGISSLAVSFILCTGSSNDLIGQRITEWSYFYSMMLLGALLLLPALAAMGRRTTRDDQRVRQMNVEAAR